MDNSLQTSDFLNYFDFTPLWDNYYESSQNMKFKNKWDKVKTGWRPRKRNEF
ncbi:MAG: hypothetical protein AAF487_07910 [Bacteroidota bacterium]